MSSSLSKLLIASGIFFIILAIFLYWQRTNPDRVKFRANPTGYAVDDLSSQAAPYSLQIESVKINAPILTVKDWEVSNKGISYLSTSPLPGMRGNSILYGHNWRSLLGNLNKVKRGDEVVINYADGTRQVFTVTDLQIVSPDQVEVLGNTNDTRLTIYTCTGLFDSKRFIVTALYSKDLVGEL